MDQLARPLRADAARKREQVLAAAVEELHDLASADGPAPRLVLERVATRAHVGVATLYRHFPTREALVEAVYRQELERLCEAAPGMLSGTAPDVALLAWMERYRDFVDSKRGMGEDLRRLVAGGAVTQRETRQRLAAAITVFLDAGAAAGVLRDGIAPDDVVAAMAGAVIAAFGDEREAQTSRLFELVLAGLRAGGGVTR